MVSLYSLLFSLIMMGGLAFGGTLPCEIRGKSGVLMNGKNGKLLFDKNKDLPIYPASTTKVATALFVLENYPEKLDEMAVGKKDALATIAAQAKRDSNYRSPPYWLEKDGVHMGIKRGEELPMKDLLYALLINSPNDAANVIAEHVGGTIPQFIDELNLYFKKIGLQKSHFMNPHGLHHPMHATTAYEMGVLACRAMKYSLFRDIVGRSSYQFPQTNLEYARTLVQGNRLIKRGSYHYPDALGIKTGYTKAAGKCLVSAAEREGRFVVAALFGYESREELYEDTKRLFEAAFNEKKKRVMLLAAGLHPFKAEVNGKKRRLVGSLPKGLYYEFYPSEKEAVKVSLEMDELLLPVAEGERVGLLVIKNGTGDILGVEPLLAGEKIAAPLGHAMLRYIRRPEAFFVLIAVCALWGIQRFRKKRRR